MKPTVLVIEDDRAILAAIRDILEMEGYETHCSSNGKEALTYLDGGTRPCLILLDLMMPVMDGVEFRKIQERNPKISDIPIALMSADGNVDVKRFNIGAQECLRKPVDLMELLGTVKKYCGSPNEK